MPQPHEHDFPAYFGKYISKVNAADPADAVAKHSEALLAFYNNLPQAKADFAYEPGKWTVKESLQHVIDTERVFSYRLLAIARGDQSELPSFDENAYTANSNASQRTLDALKEEFTALRRSTDLLLLSLDGSQ